MLDQPGIGHNKPLNRFDELTGRVVDMRRAAIDWINVTIFDGETAEAAERLRKEARSLRQGMDAVRAEEKKVHDDAARRVQAKWKPHIETLDKIVAFYGSKITAFALAEAERRTAQRAARRAELEAKRDDLDRLAEVAAAVPTESNVEGAIAAAQAVEGEEAALEQLEGNVKIKGGLGPAASLRKFEDLRIEDPVAVLGFLAVNGADLSAVIAGLTSAARQYRLACKRDGKDAPDIPGLAVTTTEKIV